MELRPFRSLPAALLDLILPRSCLLCARPLLPPPLFAGPRQPQTGAPLCPSCALSLQPIREPRCSRCGTGLISEEGLCRRCRGREWSFERVLPLFAYEGAFQVLLSAYKFADRRSLAGLFAQLLAARMEGPYRGSCLVPVPPRPGKLRERGWDQVDDIVRVLERRGFELRRLLVRQASTQQKRLGLAARRDNARAAYVLARGVEVPKRVILVDDIVTTCATAEACAAVLRGGGAESVIVVALAAD